MPRSALTRADHSRKQRRPTVAVSTSLRSANPNHPLTKAHSLCWGEKKDVMSFQEKHRMQQIILDVLTKPLAASGNNRWSPSRALTSVPSTPVLRRRH